MSDKLAKVNKKLIVAILIGVILLTAYLIYVFFGDFFAELYSLIKTGDQEKIAEYLNSRSQWGGYVALFFCSILQVVSIFIPGMVIQITGALIYGWWRFLPDMLAWFYRRERISLYLCKNLRQEHSDSDRYRRQVDLADVQDQQRQSRLSHRGRLHDSRHSKRHYSLYCRKIHNYFKRIC